MFSVSRPIEVVVLKLWVTETKVTLLASNTSTSLEKSVSARETTGIKLGNPTNTADAAAKGRKISIDEADRFAQTVLPIIASIQRSGITSLRGLAIAMNNRGVRTARNGQWQVSNVRNILARQSAANLLL